MSLVRAADPVLLIGLGMLGAYIYQRWLYRNNEDWYVFLGVLSITVFWFSLLLSPILETTQITLASGRQSGSLMVSLFYALAYPFWFWVGGRFVFMLFGTRPEEGGVIWLYRIEDRTESFESAWEK